MNNMFPMGKKFIAIGFTYIRKLYSYIPYTRIFSVTISIKYRELVAIIHFPIIVKII